MAAMPGRDELPATLRRSPAKAQRTWIEVHDAAVEQYGEGERAHRTAFAALKHSFEKVGDRWVPKKEKGPSDPRSKGSTAQKRRNQGEAFGGVDYYGHTKTSSTRAKRLGVRAAADDEARARRAIARKQD